MNGEDQKVNRKVLDLTVINIFKVKIYLFKPGRATMQFYSLRKFKKKPSARRGFASQRSSITGFRTSIVYKRRKRNIVDMHSSKSHQS